MIRAYLFALDPIPEQVQAFRSHCGAQRTCSRRRGPDKHTRTEPSQRWRKAKAKVSAGHIRVANARRDGLHKLTTRLVREHDVIVVEDLNAASSTTRPRRRACMCTSPTGGTRAVRPARRAVR